LLKSQLNISCTIYEIRSTPATLGGAIVVGWNALRILDSLGIYKELQTTCAETPDFELYNANGGKIGTLSLGAFKQKYGYGVMRVLRSVLHQLLLRRLYVEGIDVKYGMTLTEIEETKDFCQNHIRRWDGGEL
jgi:2-polyprenyl-6-methoxyphenol hydroxylase-like FAD-dependent oxidoreductase